MQNLLMSLNWLASGAPVTAMHLIRGAAAYAPFLLLFGVLCACMSKCKAQRPADLELADPYTVPRAYGGTGSNAPVPPRRVSALTRLNTNPVVLLTNLLQLVPIHHYPKYSPLRCGAEHQYSWDFTIGTTITTIKTANCSWTCSKFYVHFMSISVLAVNQRE